MQGQELRDEIAMMLKALRKAGYENRVLVRQKLHIAYKCSNNQDALAWNIYEQTVTVKELKAFLDEVPDDLFVRLEYDHSNDDYTTISFTSEEKVTDEYWYPKLTRLYNQLLYKKKQQEKELQLEPIRKKVINKEGLTIQELDFLFNK